MLDEISSGISAFDRVIDGLKPGDNVVFQVERLSDYAMFARPFLQRSLEDGRDTVYVHFAPHPAIMDDCSGLETVVVDPSHGFDYFSRAVHNIIEEHGKRAFYVLDNLSALAVEWATDELLANFFQITCPLMYEMECVAYFALNRGKHAHSAIARIRDTTQILVDVYSVGDQTYVHPIKVWDRYSTQMFLPHLVDHEEWEPISESEVAAAVSVNSGASPLQPATGSLAPWDSVYEKLKMCTAIMSESDPEVLALKRELGRMMLGSQEDFDRLAGKNFSLPELLAVRSRMIGSGPVGGKAAGMLLARSILSNRGVHDGVDFREVIVNHDSFYIGSDVFFTYLVENDLFNLRLKLTNDSHIGDEEFRKVEQRFLEGRFPHFIIEQFRDLLDYFGQAPIIVRSSSLLEDSFGNAFAGKYRSEFCANQGTPEQRLESFIKAVKLVYASALNPDALAYRRNRGLGVSEEQMAILVQRVSGSQYQRYFFPMLAGVAFSRNLYAWGGRIDPLQGVVRLVFGLGTRAVDRVGNDYPRMIALSHPEFRVEDPRQTARYSQHYLDLIDTGENRFDTLPIDSVLTDGDYPHLGLLISLVEDGSMIDFIGRHLSATHGEPVLTFNNLIRRTDLVRVLRAVLSCLEEEYESPVDIEFTASVDGSNRIRLNLLQCRPLFVPGETGVAMIPDDLTGEQLLFSSNRMINGGFVGWIRFILFIDPRRYNAVENERLKMGTGRVVGRVNRHQRVAEDGVVMMGPGRWGSSNVALGVNTRYAEIDNAAALVEVAWEESGQVPEVSYGTHFFQDLIESQIIYMPLWPMDPGSDFNESFFENAPNALAELLPDEADYESFVKLIDIPAATGGKYGCVIADPRSRKAVMFLEG